MKCSEVENLIWTHEELSVAQTNAIGIHLTECQQCQQVWEESLILMRAVCQCREESPSPKNAAQLTRRIMDAVSAEAAPEKSRTLWVDVIHSAWLRYAMACVSLTLTLSFLYDTAKPRIKNKSGYVYSGQIELKSAAFIENELRQQSKSTFSLMSCIRNQNCPPSLYERRSQYENRQ